MKQQKSKFFVFDVFLQSFTTIYPFIPDRFLFGDSAPLFTLIGVSLASGTGILTKDDELEGVCWEIRVSIFLSSLFLILYFNRVNYSLHLYIQEAVSRLQYKEDAKQKENLDEIGLHSLNIGQPIAKGCSAVVYAAALKNPIGNANTSTSSIASDESDGPSSPVQNRPEAASPIQHANRFVHNFGSSVDNLQFSRYMETLRSAENETTATDRAGKAKKKVQFNSKPNVSYQNSHHSTSSDSSFSSLAEELGVTGSDDISQYPLALKMMFNYDIQSNAMSILRAMYKETIPAIHKYNNPDADSWEKSLMEQTVNLPPHPNIVAMVGVFCAQIPNLMQSTSLYPMALPQRIHPEGYGRNMSLFLLMKRYDSNLYDYLNSETNITMRTRILLFTQLLEAVAHLYRNGVAHRDLKTDNILIDLNGNDAHPILVLSDFGCCLADKNNGLCIPYPSYDIDKGGNTALMAPEIITKTPGTFAILDYTKADLWACGAISYEIFGMRNPFYKFDQETAEAETNKIKILKNNSYNDEDLPELNAEVPFIVRKLIENILHRNPNKRLTPDIAANVMQLFLWAPSSWLKPYHNTTINSPEILQWLLSLTTKVLYDGRLNANKGILSINRKVTDFKASLTSTFASSSNNRAYTEYLLLSSFLMRSQLQQIRSALNWIQHTLDVSD